MKIGLFGGSFDPIHAGHVLPVKAARAELGLERVIYLPTADPPHKPDRRLAPAHARYAMVEMALLGEEGLYASAYELTPGRRAYTVETVEHFQRELPDAEIHLLIGSDSLAELTTWRRWRQLVSLVRLVVLARPGWELAAVEASLPAELAGLLAGAHRPAVIEKPVDLSATHLRQLLGRGEQPPAGSVAPLVLDYVAKYGFYR